jgi:hypothetical protein
MLRAVELRVKPGLAEARLEVGNPHNLRATGFEGVANSSEDPRSLAGGPVSPDRRHGGSPSGGHGDISKRRRVDAGAGFAGSGIE